MEQIEIYNINNYSQYKQAVDMELTKSAEGFVRIGYLLKLAKETDILKESGYENVNDFARAEYGLTKDQVSRFININTRFSINGRSDKLQDKYQKFGVAKLAEMLTLSDEIIEALPEDITRKEIQEVKREIREEESISDLEVMMEETDHKQQELDDTLKMLIHQYYKDNPQEFIKAYDNVVATYIPTSELTSAMINAIAPSGIATLMIRIAGAGRFMISIKGLKENIEIVNVRTNEKQQYTWEDIVRAVRLIYPVKANAEVSWTHIYEVPFPKPEPKLEPKKEEPKKPEVKKKEVAPVQPKEVEEHKDEEQIQKPSNEDGSNETSDIRTDEAAKDNGNVCQEESETKTDINDIPIPADNEESEPERLTEDDIEIETPTDQKIKTYSDSIEMHLRTMQQFINQKSWKPARTQAEKIIECLNKIIDITEDIED